MATKRCNNQGCGKTYTDEENFDGACTYHPKPPIFHEGLKSWSCCEKRSADFDDFMAFPGCSSGPHVTRENYVAQVAPSPNAPLPSAAPAARVVATGDAGAEVYSSGSAKPAVKPLAAASSTSKAASTAPGIAPSAPKPVVVDDAVDAVIAVGAACRRNGCRQLFVDDTTRAHECVFHPGSAIFHEGSKGWSCCSRKVLEFEEFLKIEGCATGRHRFVALPDEVAKETATRVDFYQSAPWANISVFARNLKKDSTSVQFNDDTITIDGVFDDGRLFSKTLNLLNRIVPAECSFSVGSVKVELKCRKAAAGTWDKLER